MKPLSSNHFKLYFINSHHHFFHWLVVVLIQALSNLILVPFSLYLAGLGLFFSVEIVQPYAPPDWLDKALLYSSKLPYLATFKYLILSQVGHWYQETLIWRGMVIGLPLILLAASIFLVSLFNLYYSIFSPHYNRTHCPFCQEPIKIKNQ